METSDSKVYSLLSTYYSSTTRLLWRRIIKKPLVENTRSFVFFYHDPEQSLTYFKIKFHRIILLILYCNKSAVIVRRFFVLHSNVFPVSRCLPSFLPRYLQFFAWTPVDNNSSTLIQFSWGTWRGLCAVANSWSSATACCRRCPAGEGSVVPLPRASAGRYTNSGVRSK